jgi:hypothetical protein
MFGVKNRELKNVSPQTFFNSRFLTVEKWTVTNRELKNVPPQTCFNSRFWTVEKMDGQKSRVKKCFATNIF